MRCPGWVPNIDTCSEYKLKLREEGDIVAESAYTVPQIDVPRRPRQQLLSRIDAGHVLDRSTEDIGFLTRVIPQLDLRFLDPSGIGLASTSAIVMVLGSI